MDIWYDILLVFWVNCSYLNLYSCCIFMIFFFDMRVRVIYFYAQWHVVKQIQVIKFLIMKSVKFLSMTFILLGFDKVGFCEMFAKRGTLQMSGREVLREVILKNGNIIFLVNYVTH